VMIVADPRRNLDVVRKKEMILAAIIFIRLYVGMVGDLCCIHTSVVVLSQHLVFVHL